jgi:hypothetical protein
LLLTVVTSVAAAAAVRGCGDCPAERHLRRAEARASAIASLASFDARTARRALERVGTRGARRRAARLARPRAARLAVPWRDALAAIQTPGRVVEATTLASAAAVLCLLNADRPLVVAASMLVAYLGASRMLWPLRSELDSPGRARVLLRPRIGRVALAHTLIPMVVTTGAALLGAAGCAVAGALPVHGPATALLVVAVTPMLACCAAMSARRGGRLPPSVFVTAVAADPSGGAGALLAYFAFWPAVAATLGGVPIVLATSAGSAAVVFAAAWTVIATVLLLQPVARDVVET